MRLSNEAFVKLMAAAKGDQTALRAALRTALPGTWGEDGKPVDGNRGENATLDAYIKIKRDAVLRSLYAKKEEEVETAYETAEERARAMSAFDRTFRAKYTFLFPTWLPWREGRKGGAGIDESFLDSLLETE